MLITLEVVSKVIDHLKPNDRLAVMTFESNTYVIQKMKALNEIDLKILKHEISQISATGGTNMSAAIDCCASLFDTDAVMSDTEYDNRILFLTDAQPNDGNLGASHFYSRIEQLAKHRVYTTFVGVGIDLNTQLISSITKHRGANYFSVHDSKKFFQLLDNDFDLILTPLVFNVKMKFESDVFDIDQVYGSPEWDETKQNELMNINTLFPSRTDDDGETRGGIVLFKLKAKQSITEQVNTNAHLSITYEDRLGKTFEEKQMIYILVNNDEIYYGNSGIRKAILLVNYVTLLKQWINDERERTYNQRKPVLNLFEKNAEKLSEWERQSTKLSVSNQYRKEFETFLKHLHSEMEVLQDKDLEQEVKLLNKLIGYEG
jgi:Ca-activated chloride channel family protein